MSGFNGIEGFTKEWAEDIKRQCDGMKKMVGKKYRVYSTDDDEFEFDPYIAQVTKYTNSGIKLKVLDGESKGEEVHIDFEQYPYFGFEQV